MADREKVISEAEEAIKILGKIDEPTFWCDFVRVAFENALELLKAQEPVSPVLVPKGRGGGVGYDCGACGAELIVLRGTVDSKTVSAQVQFCRMCGRQVKWDE